MKMLTGGTVGGSQNGPDIINEQPILVLHSIIQKIFIMSTPVMIMPSWQPNKIISKIEWIIIIVIWCIQIFYYFQNRNTNHMYQICCWKWMIGYFYFENNKKNLIRQIMKIVLSVNQNLHLTLLDQWNITCYLLVSKNYPFILSNIIDTEKKEILSTDLRNNGLGVYLYRGCNTIIYSCLCGSLLSML